MIPLDKYIDYIVNEIKELANIPSPSGNASNCINYIKSKLENMGLQCKLTHKGGLIASLNGTESIGRRTVCAHADTLGAMVKGIKDNGRLYFEKIGYYALNSIECENCFIETFDYKIYSGTVYCTKPSIHLDDDMGKYERKLDNMEIVIDENVNSKKEAEDLGIEVGDFVSFDPRFKVTPSGFIKSRHLDDKASVGIILGVLKYMTENNIKPVYNTDFYFTNYEEVSHGAASSINPDTSEILCIDMGAPGENQNSSEHSVCICAWDSAGPHDYVLRKKLTAISKECGIDYRIDMYPNYVSDGTVALRAGCDARVGIIGTGVYASHSYERTHKDGLINSAKLLKEYLIRK